MLALSHNEAPLFVFVIFVIVIVFVFVFIFVRGHIGSAPEQEQLALFHNEGALFDPNVCSTYHPINPSGDQAGDKIVPVTRNFVGQCISEMQKAADLADISVLFLLSWC